ncbi:MAG: hypothetical protein GY851_00315 [bacterium]|nr:hypothetical protein [bacterium]
MRRAWRAILLITIIHLSDLHIHRKADAKDNRNARTLVREIVRRHGHVSKRNTYIVITGDLVDSITRPHYENLRRLVLDPLRREHFKVLATPGNHDYARMGNSFRPEGPALFHEYVQPGQYPHVYPSDARVAPGTSEVRFIGLDTADKQEQVFLANGVIDERQLEEFRHLLETHKNEFIVVHFHHHPFIFNPAKAFRKYAQFMRAIRGRHNLVVLFGHHHRSRAFFGRAGIPLMLASNKVTRATRGVLSYRVVTLDRKAEGFGKGLTGVDVVTVEFSA